MHVFTAARGPEINPPTRSPGFPNFPVMHVFAAPRDLEINPPTRSPGPPYFPDVHYFPDVFSRSRRRPRVLVVCAGPLALTPGPGSDGAGGLISGPLAAVNTCGGSKNQRSGKEGRRINFWTPCGRKQVRGLEKSEVRKSGSAD